MAKDALELVLGDYIPSLFKDAPKSSEIRSLNLDKNQCIALIEVDIEQLIKKIRAKRLIRRLHCLRGLMKQE